MINNIFVFSLISDKKIKANQTNLLYDGIVRKIKINIFK